MNNIEQLISHYQYLQQQQQQLKEQELSSAVKT